MINVLILSERKAASAPRIHREIAALEAHFNIFLCAADNSSQSYHRFIDLYSLRSLKDKILSRKDQFQKKIQHRYSGLDKLIEQNNIEVLIIHDPLFILDAVRLKLKFGLKIIFNAHEYYPLEFEDDKLWLSSEGKLYHELYKTELHKFDLIINVCETIRQKCFDDYHLDSIVIPNAAEYQELTPVLNNDQDRIRIIHHGALLPGRKIEKMIEAVGTLGKTHTLDLIGTTTTETAEYQYQISALCDKYENVSMISPVPFDQIVTVINNYDIGLYLLEPSNFNNLNALPNKLFEFIQARLAIVISPSPEMRSLVQKYKNGVVSDNFTISSIREALCRISREDIISFKQNSHLAASVENAEKYSHLYLDCLLSLLKN